MFKTTGDGFLAEFASPVEAVRCALDVQEALAPAATREPSGSLQLRIGINLGDIIVEEDGDVYGDGVNVAARLQQLAEAGGILISAAVFEHVDGKIEASFDSRGDRQIKNILKPVRVYAVHVGQTVGGKPVPPLKQSVSFCRAPDGVQLAWTAVGSGPPLFKAANWMNHLEYDWESPIFHHFLERLASGHTLIRYDARGNGMSDWDVEELSLDAWVSDLETVVEAAGLTGFPCSACPRAALSRSLTPPDTRTRFRI